MELETWELQELVFLMGSKKAFAIYLGVEPKRADVLWKKHNLQTPIGYLRLQDQKWLQVRLVKFGSTKAMARYYGVSDAALRSILSLSVTTVTAIQIQPLTKEILSAALSRYKSMRLTYRMLRKLGYAVSSESAVRKQAEEWGLDLVEMLDWSFSNHANAKGRRAELEFARIRGANILEDCNKTQGSQCETDFVDKMFGRVNVKSSRTYRLRAKTRRSDPLYGKFSTGAIERSDTVALMLYDRTGRNFMGMKMVRPVDMGTAKSFNLSSKEFK